MDRELERNPDDPWCLVIERLISAIDGEVQQRPGVGGLPVM
jgi:hypothetical protein